MTSTTYSDKKQITEFKQGRSMYFWLLRKNSKLLVAYVIMLMITLPVIQTIFLARSFMDSISTVDEVDLIRTIYPSGFSLVAVAFTLIAGLVTFSFMHNKRAVDLYSSLPIRKSTQFLSCFAAAFTLSWAPMLLVTAAGGFICLLHTPAGIWFMLDSFIWLTLSIIANLAMIAFLSVCAGNVTDVIVSYLAIGAAWPVIVLFFYMLPPTVIPGLANPWYSINPALITALSPITVSFLGVYYYHSIMKSGGLYYDYMPETWGFVLWWVIFIAVLFAACIILIKRRKNECAQSDFSFPAPQIIIRVMCNFVSGLGLGMLFVMFAESQNNFSQLVWFAIGAGLGSFASHVILQLVYKQRFRNFSKTLIYYLPTLVLTIVFIFCLTWGWFGTDTYVPRAEDIKTIKLDMNIYTYNEDMDSYSVKSINSVELTTPEEIDSLLKIHSEIVKSLSEQVKKPYSLLGTSYTEYFSPYSYTGNEKNYSDLNITYTTNKDVVRSYRGNIAVNDEIEEEIENLLSMSDAVRKSIYLYRTSDAPYYDENDKYEVGSIELLSENYYEEDGSDVYYQYRGDAARKIAQALRKDLDSKEDILKYIYDGYYDKTDYNYICIRLDYNKRSLDYDPSAVEEFNIDSTFTNTLKALEEIGVNVNQLYK